MDTRQGLTDALQVWEEFDVLVDSLGKWLREMEGLIKDYELKSTLPDKQAQVEKFKVGQFLLPGHGNLLLSHHFNVIFVVVVVA